MLIATIQFAPEFAKVDVNVAFIERTIAATDADVIVFPELATCGYLFLSREEVSAVALNMLDPAMQRISDTAVKNNRVVICGFAESDGTGLFNSALIAGPGIKPHAYRKTHLFYKETQCFDEGNTGFSVVNIEHLDCKLGVMICYDWRFPESARTLALKGADVIACPSNLVTHLWRMTMPVRALENKVYLAVANRYGLEQNGQEIVSFNGQSAIYDYEGKILQSAEAHGQSILIAEIDPQKTRDKMFNSINDIFRDRRPERYNL